MEWNSYILEICSSLGSLFCKVLCRKILNYADSLKVTIFWEYQLYLTHVLLILPTCYWWGAEIDNHFHRHTGKHCGTIFVYFNSPNFIINAENSVTFAMKFYVDHIFAMIDRSFLPGTSCLLTVHHRKSIWDGPWLSHFHVMCTRIYMCTLHKEQKSSQQLQNGICSL